jgi:hypothetical protein
LKVSKNHDVGLRAATFSTFLVSRRPRKRQSWLQPEICEIYNARISV